MQGVFDGEIYALKMNTKILTHNSLDGRIIMAVKLCDSVKWSSNKLLNEIESKEEMRFNHVCPISYWKCLVSLLLHVCLFVFFLYFRFYSQLSNVSIV